MGLRVLLAATAIAALALPLAAQSPEERLRQQLETPYKRWVDEEVRWVIDDNERAAFQSLQTDELRMAFIENFWLHRDPTPGTDANEFREEHYRRIAWSNDRFASATPGWLSDRGRIYIRYGAPDEREEHPAEGTERWRYRSLEGVGRDVMLEFVGPDYRLTSDPAPPSVR